jgi:transformation/transcription domain-associated protein
MNPSDNLELKSSTTTNIRVFADSLYPGHMKIAFISDFATTTLNLEEYVAKLRIWRDKFEAMLDARPRKQKLESSSHYLVEFQHQKFDDVEIPGQYLLLKDNANDFLRIDRFLPEVEMVRNYGNCFRRLSIRGHDGSVHPFVIQNPSARLIRREERLMQLFRILNSVLERKKESRMRNLKFHLPAIIPLAPNVRMVEDDPSYCTLYDIYEDHCDDINIHKDDPLAYFVEKLKADIKTNPDVSKLTFVDI